MNKEKLKVDIELRQEALNKKYAKEGLTDEVLEEQVKLNQLRHEHDIVDETELIFEDFVQ